MEKIFRYLKIFIAACLVGCLVFFGMKYYIEQTELKKQNEAAIMDMLVSNNDKETKEFKMVELNDEGKKNRINEYIDGIYLEEMEKNPLDEVIDIDFLTEKYISYLAYFNLDSIEREPDDEGIKYYSYPELNTLIVQKLGKKAHNIFPDKTTEFFKKTTKGFYSLIEDEENLKKFEYVLDTVKVDEEGYIYADIYEYVIEDELQNVEITVEDSGKKLNLYDINGILKLSLEYEILPYSESELTINLKDTNGKIVEKENIDKYIIENKGVFVKRTIVLEEDIENNLFYMKSNEIY